MTLNLATLLLATLVASCGNVHSHKDPLLDGVDEIKRKKPSPRINTERAKLSGSGGKATGACGGSGNETSKLSILTEENGQMSNICRRRVPTRGQQSSSEHIIMRNTAHVTVLFDLHGTKKKICGHMTVMLWSYD